MRFTCALTMTACLLLAGPNAWAQTAVYNSPGLLPIPATRPPAISRSQPVRPVGPGYGASPYEAAPQNAGVYGARPVGWRPGSFINQGRPGPVSQPRASNAENIWGEQVPAADSEGLWAEQGPPTIPSSQPELSGPVNAPGNCPSCNMGDCATCNSPFANALQGEPIAPIAMPWGGAFRPSMWFGSLAGMILTRDNPNKYWTSFNVNNAYDQTLNTQDAAANWAGGGQVMFGRWFGCSCNPMYGPAYGVQFVYWGVAPMTGSASITNPNNIWNTPINLGYTAIGNQPTTDFFDNAYEHRITRNDQFYNFELNALRRVAYGPGGLMFTGLAGARFFRFNETLSFGSVAGGHHFGDAGGAYEAYYDTHVTNSLAGFQLGGRVDWFALPRWRLYAQPVFGIFGNHTTIDANVYSGNGVQGSVQNIFNTNVTSPFRVQSAKNGIAMLGQIDVGTGFQITPRFSAFAAYRVMAFSRMALADNQIPPFLVDQAAIRDIQTNGNLILHGVVIGGMYNY
jgi:hypothetical protein